MKSFFKIYILGTVAAVVIWILYKTIRWERNDFSKLKVDQPLIAVFWHGKQLMMAPASMALRKANPSFKKKARMLVSRHTDGRLIGWAVRFFGIDTVHGSTTRGGVSALRKLKDSIAKGHSIAISPDGPKGPIHKVKRGAIYLAVQTGKPIVPITINFSRYWTVRSWDKMEIPKPFCKAECRIGEPIYLANVTLEEQLNISAQEVAEQLDNIK